MINIPDVICAKKFRSTWKQIKTCLCSQKIVNYDLDYPTVSLFILCDVLCVKGPSDTCETCSSKSVCDTLSADQSLGIPFYTISERRLRRLICSYIVLIFLNSFLCMMRYTFVWTMTATTPALFLGRQFAFPPSKLDIDALSIIYLEKQNTKVRQPWSSVLDQCLFKCIILST